MCCMQCDFVLCLNIFYVVMGNVIALFLLSFVVIRTLELHQRSQYVRRIILHPPSLFLVVTRVPAVLSKVPSLQVSTIGEALVEVGAPDGWGPLGLTAAHLEAVLARLRSAMDAVEADVTVLRQRQVHIPTLGDAGACRLLCSSLVMAAAGCQAAVE